MPSLLNVHASLLKRNFLKSIESLKQATVELNCSLSPTQFLKCGLLNFLQLLLLLKLSREEMRLMLQQLYCLPEDGLGEIDLLAGGAQGHSSA